MPFERSLSERWTSAWDTRKWWMKCRFCCSFCDHSRPSSEMLLSKIEVWCTCIIKKILEKIVCEICFLNMYIPTKSIFVAIIFTYYTNFSRQIVLQENTCHQSPSTLVRKFSSQITGSKLIWLMRIFFFEITSSIMELLTLLSKIWWIQNLLFQIWLVP